MYVTGCSHTAGTHLSLPDKNDRYARVLQTKYGYEVDYDALPGASNERIFRRAVENLSNEIADTGSPYDIAVFQWTSIDRFETPQFPQAGWLNNTQFVRVNDWVDHRPWSSQWAQRAHFDIPFRKFYHQCYHRMPPLVKDKNKPLTHEQREDWRIMMAVQKRLEKKMFGQMLSIDAFFKSMGVEKVLHMNFDPITRPHDDPLGNLWRSSLDHMFDEIRGMDYILPTYGHQRCMISNEHDGKGTVDGHFMKDAHAHIAEWVHGFITGELKEPIKRAGENTFDEDRNIALFHYDTGEPLQNQGQWLRENQFND